MDHLVWVSHDEHTVLRLTAANPGDDRGEGGMVTAHGRALFGAAPGEHLRIAGTWVTHPRYGRQLKAAHCERTSPSTLPALRRYLASPRIKGIGPTLAAAIVHTFGTQTLTVIDTDPPPGSPRSAASDRPACVPSLTPGRSTRS